MKKLVVLIFMLLPLGGVFAQDKIAIVNTADIFNAMPEVAAVEKKMAALNEQYEKEFKTMQDEYTKKYSEYMSKQDSLTENIKLRRQQEIQDLETRIQNFVPVAQQEIQKKQEELIKPIQDQVYQAVKDVATEGGYAAIIDVAASGAVLYSSPRYDKSDEVLKRMGY